jgi:hypothetical protein
MAITVRFKGKDSGKFGPFGRRSGECFFIGIGSTCVRRRMPSGRLKKKSIPETFFLIDVEASVLEAAN